MLSNTDAKILGVLSEGRNVPGNMADATGNDVSYISRRLKQLVEDDYIEHVGKPSRSLYEITHHGEDALRAYQTLNKQLEDARENAAETAAGGE